MANLVVVVRVVQRELVRAPILPRALQRDLAALLQLLLQHASLGSERGMIRYRGMTTLIKTAASSTIPFEGVMQHVVS